MAVDARGTPAAEAEPSAPSAARRARLPPPRPPPRSAAATPAPPPRPEPHAARRHAHHGTDGTADELVACLLPGGLACRLPRCAGLLSIEPGAFLGHAGPLARSRLGSAHVVTQAQLLAHALDGLLHARELRVGGRAVLAVRGDGLLGACELFL